jgi:hypothetical protein
VDVGSSVDAGDVVIAPEVRDSHLVYVLRVEGGTDQLTYHTRTQATATAIEYARRQKVNVWYGDRAELGLVPLGWFRRAPRTRTTSAPTTT